MDPFVFSFSTDFGVLSRVPVLFYSNLVYRGFLKLLIQLEVVETDCLRFQVGRIPFISVFQLIFGVLGKVPVLEFLVYFSQRVLGLVVALPGHDEATPCRET